MSGASGYGGPQKKGLAVASMVLGIVGVVLWCFWYVAVPCLIVGLALGATSLSKEKRDPTIGGHGMAVAGLVLNIIGLALWAILLIFFWSFIAGLESL